MTCGVGGFSSVVEAGLRRRLSGPAGESLVTVRKRKKTADAWLVRRGGGAAPGTRDCSTKLKRKELASNKSPRRGGMVVQP